MSKTNRKIDYIMKGHSYCIRSVKLSLLLHSPLFLLVLSILSSLLSHNYFSINIIHLHDYHSNNCYCYIYYDYCYCYLYYHYFHHSHSNFHHYHNFHHYCYHSINENIIMITLTVISRYTVYFNH